MERANGNVGELVTGVKGSGVRSARSRSSSGNAAPRRGEDTGFFLGGGGGGFFMRTVTIGGPSPGANGTGAGGGGGGTRRSRSRGGGTKLLVLAWRSRSDSGWTGTGAVDTDTGDCGGRFAEETSRTGESSSGVVGAAGSADSTISQESKASLVARSLPLSEKNRREARKLSLRNDGGDDEDGEVGTMGVDEVRLRSEVVLRMKGEDLENASEWEEGVLCADSPESRGFREGNSVRSGERDRWRL